MIGQAVHYWVWRQRFRFYLRRRGWVHRISWWLWLRFGPTPEQMTSEIEPILSVAKTISQIPLDAVGRNTSQVLLPFLHKLHHFGFSQIDHSEEDSRRGGNLVLSLDSGKYYFCWDAQANLRIMRTDSKRFRNPRKDGGGYPLWYDFAGKLLPLSFPIEVKYHNYVGGMAGEGGEMVIGEDGSLARGNASWIY